MRITRISGENIASLAQPFDVNLEEEPLRSAGIFAITGATGAGKSTLLDVICLALYNNTPRLSGAYSDCLYEEIPGGKPLSYGDPRTLLHRGATEGRAEVCFEADGMHYKAGWYVRRAGKKATGQLRPVEMSLYNLTEDREIPGNKTEILARIKELIGLSFSQFTKAVLLAQGAFASFLLAKENEKGETLMRITGTELFSRIGTAIFTRTEAASSALRQLEKEAEHFNLPEKGACEALEAEINSAKAALPEANKAYDSAAEKLHLLETYASLWQRSTEARTALEQLLPQYRPLAATARRRSFLKRTLVYADKQRLLANIKARMESLDDERQTKEKELLSINEEQTAADNAQNEVKTRYNAWLAERETQLPDLKKAEETEHRSGLLKGELGQLNRQIAAAEQLCEAKATHIEQIKRQLATAEARQKELTHWMELHAAEQPFLADASLHLIHIARLAELASLQKQLTDEAATQQKRLAEAEAAEQRLGERLRAYANVVTEAVAHLRESLEPGRPCPVCGSTDHPIWAEHSHATVVKSAEEAAQKRKEWEAELASGMRLTKQLYGEVAATKSRLEQTDTELLALLEQERDVICRFCGVERIDRYSPFSDYAARIAARISEWTTHTQQLSEVQKQYNELLNERTRIEQERQTELLALTELRQTHAAQSLVLSQNAASIPALIGFPSVNDYKESVRSKENGFKEQLADIAKRRTALETRGTECRKRIEAIAAESTAEAEKLTREREACCSERDALARYFGSEASIPAPDAALVAREDRQASALSAEWNRLTTLYRERGDMLRKTEQALPGLKERAERNELGLWHAETEGEVTAARAYFNELNGVIARKETLLAEYRERMNNFKALSQKIDAARTYAARWDELNRLLGSKDGNKFNNIAQGYTLDRLIRYANRYLLMLAPRYKLLRTPGTLILEVRDEDMLGEKRPVHSLSGGETFLVSLALSLALSGISSLRIPVDSLFIDEGFGALDEETLHTAMTAFEALRNSGRKIGIISHVKEVTERIGVRIEVQKYGNGESRLSIIAP